MLRATLCQRKKRRGNMTWYVRLFDPETGEVRFESLKTTLKTEARDLMQAKLARGEFERKPGNDMTLAAAFNIYVRRLEERGNTPSYVGQVSVTFAKLGDLLGRRVSELDRESVREAFVRGAEGLAPSSFNEALTRVRSAFRFFADVLEVIPKNWMESVQTKRSPKKEKPFWTKDEIDRLLDHAKAPKLRMLWALMAFAGLRVHEALKLKDGDIRDGFVHVTGKGGKFARIPVCTRLRNELARYGRRLDFSDYSPYSSNYWLGIAARAAFGDSMQGRAGNHRLRHSFASNLIRSGVNVRAVQKLMRHSNIQTTLNIYAHLLDSDLAEAVDVF